MADLDALFAQDPSLSTTVELLARDQLRRDRPAPRRQLSRADVPEALQELTIAVASVSDTLRIQADEVRARRRQRAAEHAQKLPVKILLPLVVCIFPVLLIVLLAPAVLTVMDELGR